MATVCLGLSPPENSRPAVHTSAAGSFQEPKPLPSYSNPMLTELSCRAARAFATPVVILGVPIICGLWLLVGWVIGNFEVAMVALTLILSVLAITMSSLVLVAQDRSEQAIQEKLNELLRAIPAANEGLVGIEELA